MKRRIVIEIETPDAENVKVVPKAGMNEEDYSEGELQAFRQQYAEDLHNLIIGYVESFVNDEDGRMAEDLMDSEQGIEDWDTLSDYGVKINIVYNEKYDVSGDLP